MTKTNLISPSEVAGLYLIATEHASLEEKRIRLEALFKEFWRAGYFARVEGATEVPKEITLAEKESTSMCPE